MAPYGHLMRCSFPGLHTRIIILNCVIFMSMCLSPLSISPVSLKQLRTDCWIKAAYLIASHMLRLIYILLCSCRAYPFLWLRARWHFPFVVKSKCLLFEYQIPPCIGQRTYSWPVLFVLVATHVGTYFQFFFKIIYNHWDYYLPTDHWLQVSLH